MLAQILERQVWEPTDRQDICDLVWNKQGEETGRWANAQHPDEAKTLPLANYNGVPWPTVQIDDTTCVFDQWANGEYAWTHSELTFKLELFFRRIHHAPTGDQSACQDDGRL